MKLHSGCCSGLKMGRGDVQGVTHCDLALFFALFPLRLLLCTVPCCACTVLCSVSTVSYSAVSFVVLALSFALLHLVHVR